ncbi:MAG: MFS transporter [Miltoncostaeaceae bacterium]
MSSTGPTLRSTAGRPRRPAGARVAVLLLAVAVGVAFADSSIVVIALPELLGRFDTTIPAVSWVITAYNLTVAVVALALVPFMRHLSAAWLTRAGLMVFSVACVVCAAAQSLGVLVAARAAQGVGGALLLAGAVSLLVAATGSTGHGVRVWGVAAVVGAAVGPALGGVLTQVADWRAIFIAQVPVGLVALAATRAPRAPGARRGRVILAGGGPPPALAGAGAGDEAVPRAGVLWGATAALGLISGALVGALFLASVLVIDGWGREPLFAALVVSALPAGAALAEPLARWARPMAAMAGGTAMVAGSMFAMAITREQDPAYLAAALGLAGLGLGLAVPPLTRLSLAGADPASAGSRSVGARHAGLVIGLVLMAPLLSADLAEVSDRATLVGAARLVDSSLSVGDKVVVGRALEEELARTPTGSVPDLRAAAEAGEGGDPAARASLGDQLEALIAPAVTRGFRGSFLLCALLGALALLPLAAMAAARGAPRGAP